MELNSSLEDSAIYYHEWNKTESQGKLFHGYIPSEKSTTPQNCTLPEDLGILPTDDWSHRLISYSDHIWCEIE